MEYNLPPSLPTLPNLRYITPDVYNAEGKRYDVVISYSSIEHDGLGRRVLLFMSMPRCSSFWREYDCV